MVDVVEAQVFWEVAGLVVGLGVGALGVGISAQPLQGWVVDREEEHFLMQLGEIGASY